MSEKAPPVHFFSYGLKSCVIIQFIKHPGKTFKLTSSNIQASRAATAPAGLPARAELLQLCGGSARAGSVLIASDHRSKDSIPEAVNSAEIRPVVGGGPLASSLKVT